MIEISVVVPVYNVEEYLCDCIDSLLLGASEVLEIILVDDGSTDRSGQMCDEYAIKDPRIKSFHKTNGGLSSARNYGIQYARGEYISFVDSDDIIHEDMFTEMLRSAHENSADIVICGMQYFTDNIAETTTCVHSEHTFASEGNQRFDFIINPKGMGDFAQNKIYRRVMIEDIRFPEGRIFEDIYTSYKLFEKAKKVVCLDKDYYYYRLRKGSISHSKKFNPKMIDIVYATGEQLEFFRDNAPEYLPFAYQKNLDANVIEYKHIAENGMLKKEKHLVSQVRDNITKLLDEGFTVTRFKKEALAIKKGRAYWSVCDKVTDLYNQLHTHPRYQRIMFNLFGKMIFE